MSTTPGFELTRQILKASRDFLRSPYDELARRLNKSRSYVDKITQEPPSDENPDGNGLPNCIDQLDVLFDFALLYAPEYAELLAQRLPRRLEAHKRAQQRFGPVSSSEINAQILTLFTETSELHAAIATNQPSERILKELADVVLRTEQLLGMRDAR
jgi:hypothetical protein